MGNSLRCCLACVLPCGALDLIRVVHINGHVDEYSRPVSAAEVLAANPHHVLSKPCSSPSARRVLVVSPDSDLKRGNIYFLIPELSVPETNRTEPSKSKTHKRKTIPTDESPTVPAAATASVEVVAEETDEYLTEILSERKATHRRRRSGRVGVWRHQLESISEDQ